MYRAGALILTLWLLWQLGISLSDILDGIAAVIDYLRPFTHEDPDTLLGSTK